MYGEKAYRERNGFTAAQASLNVVESAGYVGYLWVVWKYGEGEGRRRSVGGGWGGVACLVGFALSVMTVSKTVLYCECSTPTPPPAPPFYFLCVCGPVCGVGCWGLITFCRVQRNLLRVRQYRAQ